jgi:hypothetical protein
MVRPLVEVVRQLSTLPDDWVIYARPPWSADSEAWVGSDGGAPSGLEYLWVRLL